MDLSFVSDDGDVLRLKAPARITQFDVPVQKEPIGELIEGDYSRKVILDMQDSQFLDSSGVGWLLVCHRKFEKAGGRMAIHTLHPFAHKVVSVLKLEKVLHIADDEAKALTMVGATV